MLATKPALVSGLDFDEEVVLYNAHPSMFRNRPIDYVVCLLLVPLFGVGFLILLCWWLHCQGTTLTVTNRRTVLRTGILSKRLSDIRNEDVRNIQLNQSFFQRILGVGSVGISSSGQSGVEIDVAGIPDPEQVRALLNQYR
ncbi:PH domain-containing protein [Isosphaeraceae bacterium EP7]